MFWLKVCCLALLLVVFLTRPSHCDIFTSLGQMTKLAQTQSDIIKYLKSLVEYEYEKIQEAEKMIDDFEFLARVSARDPDNFIGNPVNAFLLIKKLHKDVIKFMDTLNSTKLIKDIQAQIERRLIMPTEEDYVGAAVALNRLEDTYLLDPADMRAKNLSEVHPLARKLTASECFDIGKEAYNRKDYYHAVRWMSETFACLDENEKVTKEEEITYLGYLAYSLGQQGNPYYAMELNKRILELDPDHTIAKANVAYYKNVTDEMKLKAVNKDTSIDELFPLKNERHKQSNDYYKNYEALCRGENQEISSKRLSKLKCRYIDYHPLLKIGPVKEEQVFDEPSIWIYHDVITEHQLQEMKKLGGFKLRRAIVRNPITGNYETADYRISKSGWLSDTNFPFLTNLTHLVSAITNLSMGTAEEWQIANYGLAGQYDPHFDFARSTDVGGAFNPKIGNRIATWLYYLESPEQGGATVFNSIGVHLRPIRRSAVFWYNLLPSGDGDYRTRHAACPVLFGSKWVSNKWIHERGQEFKRPCNSVQEQNDPKYLIV